MPGFGDTWWVKPKQLDPIQAKAYALPKNQNHLVLGPPGSGKTNILLLRAEYLTRGTEPNIRLLVFNRPLQEFIRQGLHGRGWKFPAERVQTHSKFFDEILWQHGETDPLPSGFVESRDERAKRMLKVIKRDKLENSFQVLLLDEVQDYTPEEINIFDRIAEHIFAAGDFDQRVYRTKAKRETVEAIVDATLDLPFHYRNGQTICRLADGIMRTRDGYKPMLPASKYDEDDKPSTAEPFKLERLEDQCQQVVERLETELKAYEGELLGIICPRNEALDTVWNLLQASPLKDYMVYQRSGDYEPFDPSKPICLCSVPAAKGLEFRTLHIIGADLLRKESQLREKAYMAVTRAKTSLSIYSSGPLIGFWQEALAGLNPPADPTLDDLLPDGDDE